MSSHLQTELQRLAEPDSLAVLTGIRRGLEKESLRITPEGLLAATGHPSGMGSPLTHSSITTDYSEALLEFITPVSTDVAETLERLEDIHSFAYRQMDEELLWCASMPCIVSGDDGIPVAHYGSSNVARMKTVYRLGLGHRYGRLMQAIAGIHYNFSMPEAFWQQEWEHSAQVGTLTDFVSTRYLDLIRNFRRHSWLLIYLFGASPAVCASFLRGRDDAGLVPFDDDGKSMHLPYGTALRMGDLGYSSSAQKGLNICYNSLENYVETLRSAILRPHPDYRDIPAGQNGDYQQLNDSLLQIENEFYSPIRPKRVTHSGETPLKALTERGIEYIEVRCIDVSPFTPVGIDAAQVRFLDTFLLYCLLEPSPLCDDDVQNMQASNLEAVVNQGRKPGLTLKSTGGERSLVEYAQNLFDDLNAVADLLDKAHSSKAYGESVADQLAKIKNPQLTPSARVLREMQEQNLPFFRLAMSYSERWASHFRERGLSQDKLQAFIEESQQSLERQRQIEQAESISFEAHLDHYFAQYRAL
ncbi:MAG: glutamate--cysteine ligase [Pseudomonadota bacterium]